MARHADAAGYDAVWVGDSVVAKPRLEPMTTLAFMAGITGRVRLGTAVLLPALRHPVVLARARGARARRGVELAVRRTRVGGGRRRSQAPRPEARAAHRDLAHALAR